MVVNKRKKNSRKHGSTTHGWGKNKHRKSGSRGGVGNAGTGKKCHANKPSIWGSDYLGKRGFVRMRVKKSDVCISLYDLEDLLPKWKRDKKVVEQAGVAIVDLKSMGYTRLLGNGKLLSKVKIIVPYATKSVEEKVVAAGGELVVDTAE